MKYLKGLTVLASGLCIVGGAFAATTVVDDDSNAKDKSLVVAEVTQDVKAPMKKVTTAKLNLADHYAKHNCFVVINGNCL